MEGTEKQQPGGGGNHGGRKAPGRWANPVEKSREAIEHSAVGRNTKDTRLRQEWSVQKEGSRARPCGEQGMRGER